MSSMIYVSSGEGFDCAIWPLIIGVLASMGDDLKEQWIIC